MSSRSARTSGPRTKLFAGLTAGLTAIGIAAAVPAYADPGHGHGTSQQQPPEPKNPPGNNGTVFIHSTGGDTRPHNVPHVGCTFWLAFFGFDDPQTVTPTFTAQAPTRKGTPLQASPSGSLSLPLSNAAAKHRFDGDQAYTLDTSSLGAPAHQGYHVKLTLATGAPGGVKHKVFWVKCPAPATTATAGQNTPALVSGTAGTAGTAVMASNATTAATTTPSNTAALVPTGGSGTTSSAPDTTAGPSTQVLGESVRLPAATHGSAALGSATGGGSLPFTGAELGLLSSVAVAAAGIGLALVLAARRRRASLDY